MGHKNDRDVVPTADGRRAVRAPNADQASGVVDRQSDAINRGREIVGNAGGDELRVHGRDDGEICDADTVLPGNAPLPPRDRP